MLDVLPVGDVGGVACVTARDVGDDPQLVVGQPAAVDTDTQHEVAVVELLRLQDRGFAAVDAGPALCVEPVPAEPAAQVSRVDGVEAVLGVDVDDPLADVEPVVVALIFLVLVERLAIAERPLAFAAFGARDLGTGRGTGGVAEVGHEERGGPSQLRGRAHRRARREQGGCSARPTDHAAGAPEVHVASYHEVGVGRGGDHVKESQGGGHASHKAKSRFVRRRLQHVRHGLEPIPRLSPGRRAAHVTPAGPERRDRRRSLVCAHDRRPHQQRLPPGPRGDRLGGAPDRGGDPSGARDSARLAQADRQRELRLAGRAAGDGHVVQRQVRRGHDRPPLLRGLPERRHGRVDRGRARPRALRRAVRLRAAALGHRRQPGRLLGDPRPPRRGARAGEAGREERQRAHRRGGRPCAANWQPEAAGHVARRRRPPHPRLPPQHQREDVPPAAVRHRPGDRAARLRRRSPRRPASSGR